MGNATRLRVGDWCVDPLSGEISRHGETARVEVRTMRLLVCLAERAGEVVSIDELLDRVWAGVAVSPDSVYQAVASLRRLLGDDPKQPVYIATVPRLGYRMVAAVGPWVDAEVETAGVALNPGRARATATRVEKTTAGRQLWLGGNWLMAVGLCLVLVVAGVWYWRLGRTRLADAPAVAAEPQNSVAVLPFLDLTQGMNEEPFADGMTEELIDKLSKVPGLRVPGPTSSFYFKGKQVPVVEIAKALHVAYVLDGSVRKSGARLRVAARLVRAESGYVVWTESYDRPFDDRLMVQDEIAGEVAKALKASIESGQR